MFDIFTTASALPRFWVAINQDQAERYLKKLTSITGGLKNISLEFKDDNFYPTDTPSVQLLTAVIDKILSRGNPTFINLNFENKIVDQLRKMGMSFIDLIEHTGGREIGYGLDLNPVLDRESILETAHNISYVNFSKNLIDNSINDAVKIEDKGLVSPSEDQFYNHIGNHFSKEFQSMFLRQVSITQLIGKDADNIKGSKVDFAIEYKAKKYVIEIDGEDHVSDEGKAENDKLRDSILNENGWQVIRIDNDEVNNLDSSHYKTLRDGIFSDFSSDIQAMDSKSTEFKAGMLSVVLPQLVHRATKAINELIQNQQFPDSDNAKVLIVEEDIPAVLNALENYYELATMLCNLNDSFHRLPKLQIDYIGDAPLIKVESNDFFSINTVKEAKKEYDLIINHSACVKTGTSGHKEKNLTAVKSKYWVRFRSAKTNMESRAMLWSSATKYDLNDFENALQSQKTDDPFPIPENTLNCLLYVLQNIFRKNNFWDGQLLVITRLLQGKNTIVLLPTGGGKSLTYQFSGLLQPGSTLIVDPLIALINDQVANLNQMGFDRAGFISSLQNASEKEIALQNVADGSYYYVFVAPERLQMENFRTQLKALVAKFPISLSVIDEAHCVSEWGHDFRPSYLHLGLNLEKYCIVDGQDPPPIVGLTGTASFAVLTDIQVELKINDEEAVILPRSFDRKEIVFDVSNVPARDKEAQLRIIVDRLPRDFKKNPMTFFALKGDETNCGIIFAMHAGKKSSLGAPKIAYKRGHNNYFTGQADAYQKIQVQNDFKKNRLQEIVATKAFGMGIDKPNIAYTIHYSIPHSVEAFYQEAGRAGRNGVEGSAKSYVIYSDDNYEIIEQVFDNSDHSDALEMMEQVRWDDRGDLLHLFWLLIQSYKNRSVEKKLIYNLWESELLPSITGLPQGSTNTVQITYKNTFDKTEKEKSIFRLVQLGIVIDYDIDFTHRCFNVRVTSPSGEGIQSSLKRFLERYKFTEIAKEISDGLNTDDIDSSIKESISRMVDFVYDEVLKKRKQSMLTMASICSNFQNNEHFKEEILNYLQESEFTEQLRGWVNKSFDEIGMESIEEIIDNLEDHDESRRLVGTARRMLDEDPENFPLMMLSVVARSISQIENEDSVLFEINRFVKKLLKYDNREISDRLFLIMISKLTEFRKSITDEVVVGILKIHTSQDFVRAVLDDNRHGLNEQTIQNLTTVLLSNSYKTVLDNSFYKSLNQ
jgi:ATP-dependent DNA helicase RecQ